MAGIKIEGLPAPCIGKLHVEPVRMLDGTLGFLFNEEGDEPVIVPSKEKLLELLAEVLREEEELAIMEAEQIAAANKSEQHTDQ